MANRSPRVFLCAEVWSGGKSGIPRDAAFCASGGNKTVPRCACQRAKVVWRITNIPAAWRGLTFYTADEKFLDSIRASGSREGQASACPWTSRRSSLPVCGTARLVHILFGSGIIYYIFLPSSSFFPSPHTSGNRLATRGMRRSCVSDEREEGEPRGADGLVRDNVPCNRLSGHDGNAKPLLVGTPRRGVRGGLGETALPGACLAGVRNFTERAGTPTLPTRIHLVANRLPRPS